MALNKVTYTDDVTVIEAENLNDIQDEIITNASLFSLIAKLKGTIGEAPNTSLDFNDYKTTGTYYCGGTNATGILNPPHSADNGYLVVNSFSSARVQQIWYGAYTGVIKTRHYNAGTNAWTLWYEVITSKGGTFGGNVEISNSSGVANQDNLLALVLGNSTPKSQTGHSEGFIASYGNNGYYTAIQANDATANRQIKFPDASGTVALNDDHTVVNGTFNTTNIPSGTTTTVASMTLAAGTWVVVGGFQFTAEFSQMAYIGFTGGNWSPVVRGNGVGGGGFCLTSIEVLSASTTINMTCYQMSGSAKSVNRVLFRAVRVKT